MKIKVYLGIYGIVLIKLLISFMGKMLVPHSGSHFKMRLMASEKVIFLVMNNLLKKNSFKDK